jgi:hypothetical protein
MRYYYRNLLFLDVVNPSFSVSKRDIEKAKRGLKQNKKITTKRPYYWALACQFAKESSRLY